MDLSTASIALLLLQALFGVVMYLLKTSNDTAKEEIKLLKAEVKEIRDKAFFKEDFLDFRNQLWGRLDKMEADFKTQIWELKK